jgi:hypothetical protein
MGLGFDASEVPRFRFDTWTLFKALVNAGRGRQWQWQWQRALWTPAFVIGCFPILLICCSHVRAQALPSGRASPVFILKL